MNIRLRERVINMVFGHGYCQTPPPSCSPVFPGSQYYRYTRSLGGSSGGVDRGYPRPLSEWTGLPATVDAAVQLLTGRTYIFADGNYYLFQNRRFKVL